MEIINTKLALYCNKKECARTDTAFLPISEVCEGTVSLVHCYLPTSLSPCWLFTFLLYLLLSLLYSHYSLIISHCSLLSAHCFLHTFLSYLVTSPCPLLDCQYLLTCQYSLFTSHYHILTAHCCDMLTAHC